LKLPHINKVVVVDVRGDRDEKFLCAYIVSSQELDITGLRGALSPMLPDYMIPSHFVRVEQIPLTPNGKVDRRALPLPEVPGRDDYTPPENEIQERLIRIWADILNIDLHESPIGIDQDFFQLGGHSLKAALMKSGIDCEFMVRVPLVQVFSTPTIRGLAAYIEETGKETAAPGDSRLVHLRKNSGDRAPLTLFLVHDGFGGVDGYGEFCSRLNSAIECWGIKAEEYESSVPSDIQIETIARDYIQLIKRVQPEGPYSVAGWSVGGTIAFEMVRQFEAAGEEIAFCALIDTLPPQKEGETGETRAFWEAAGTLLEDPSMDTERIRERVPAEISRGIPGFDRLPAAELIRHLNIVRSLHGAAIRYIPSRRVKSPVHFFWAGRGHQVDKEAWHEYAVEPVAFIRVEGDHFSIMKKPDVEIFVKQFGSVLEI
jgi:thioesterase domain-containing protein/acyl carrier protein